jgi:RHS repeat-associated protein
VWRTAKAGGFTRDTLYADASSRVWKESAAETTLYFGPLAELTGASLTKYYWAGPLLVAKRDATGPYFYHQDHLGSVRALTNGSGALVRSYDYAPFGATVATSGAVANALGWGGHRTDAETGLVYLNARYYDPQLGRFISADPVIPDEGNPQALNRYAFGYNNPVSNVDPSGHAPVVAAVVAVVSVAASTAPAWVVAVAAVGAACTIAGYALKDPLLMTIGSIALGFAGGFAAPMFGMSALAGGVLGAAVAAATSPLSPLDPGLKQAIGWGYTALGLISSLTRPPAHDELRGAGGATDQRAGVTPAEQKANLDKLLAEHPEGLDAKLVYGDINANATATAAGMQHSTMGLYAHGTDTWLGEIGGNPDGAGLYLAKTAGAGGPAHATAMWTIQNISKDQLYKAIDAANSVLNPGPSGYATAWVCHNVAARISDALGQSYTWSVVGGGVAAQAAFGNGGLWSNLWRSATPGLGSLLAGENLLVGAYRLFH